MSAALKTPISLLQELCAQQGFTPEYKLMSVEGAVHAPTFMYRVQVGDVVATATGQSKKKAKHAVAKAALEKLLSEQGGFSEGFVTDGIVIDAKTLNTIAVEPAQTGAAEDTVQGNPVGALQELCMKQRWQPPFYETESETGLPHERVFTIICYVDNFTEIGTGKSKRLAKRQAADNMLKRLQNLKLTNGDDNKEKVNGTEVSDSKEKKKDCKESNIKSSYAEAVTHFLCDLKASKAPSLVALQDIDLSDNNLDCVKMLEDISCEQNITITYLPLEEKGKSGDYHCLVQINSLPLAVCFGSGSTREDAQANAARYTLNFIQVISENK